METITQKWVIPKNRKVRVEIDLPERVPTGEADVVMVIVPRRERVVEKLDLMKFAGCLKDSKALAGDPVAIQQALRDEWE